MIESMKNVQTSTDDRENHYLVRVNIRPAMTITSPQCQEDQNRADFMEYLFHLHERADKKVPLGLRHTFTGLAEQHKQYLIDTRVSNWHLKSHEYQAIDAANPPKNEYPDQQAGSTIDGDSSNEGLSSATDEHEGESANPTGDQT